VEQARREAREARQAREEAREAHNLYAREATAEGKREQARHRAEEARLTTCTEVLEARLATCTAALAEAHRQAHFFSYSSSLLSLQVLAGP